MATVPATTDDTDLGLSGPDVPKYTAEEALDYIRADAVFSKRFDRLLAKLDVPVQSSLEAFRALGEEIEWLRPQAKRGLAMISALAVATEISHSHLIRSSLFARWPEERYKMLLERRTDKTQKLLTYSHAYELIDIDSPKKIDSLLETCYKKSLTVRELRDLVEQATAHQHTPGRRTPRGISSTLKHACAVADSVHHMLTETLPGPLAELAKLGEEEVDDKALKELEAAHKRIQALVDQGTERVKDFDEIEKHIKEVLDVRQQREQEEAERAKQEAETKQADGDQADSNGEAEPAQKNKRGRKPKRRPVPA